MPATWGPSKIYGLTTGDVNRTSENRRLPHQRRNMRRSNPRFTPACSKLARVALAGAVLFGAAPVGVAQATLPPVTVTTPSPVDGTWMLTVVADPLARANGRDDCFEYL